MNKYKYKIRTAPVGVISVPVDFTSKERVNRRLDVDPFGTSRNLLNPCGFPMNDIMAFENAQSDSVARTILQRIKVLPDSGLTEDGRSVDEHFQDICPSNWSSPAEYVRYQKMVAEHYYNRVKAKADAQKVVDEGKINFKTDSE